MMIGAQRVWLKKWEKKNVYRKYIERSQNYINVFDGSTKFFRGKRMDGNWETSFNPFEVGRSYTEATAWQYRFSVPYDVNGMVQLFGGQGKIYHCTRFYIYRRPKCAW